MSLAHYYANRNNTYSVARIDRNTGAPIYGVNSRRHHETVLGGNIEISNSVKSPLEALKEQYGMDTVTKQEVHGKVSQVAIFASLKRAMDAFPGYESMKRISSAFDLIKNGHVTLYDDGSARVKSEDGTKHYECNGTCECADYMFRYQEKIAKGETPSLPQGLCKHRFATYILRRSMTIQSELNGK